MFEGRMRRSVIFAATMCVTTAPAHAATLDELARKAVIEQCPELMTYDGPLAEEASVVAAGYSYVGTRVHPRAGTLDVVEIAADDGNVWIANSREASMCQVGMEGASAKATFDALFVARDEIAEGLQPDITGVPEIDGVRIVTLRTETINGGYFGVQFIDPTGLRLDNPLMIQQYFLEEE